MKTNMTTLFAVCVFACFAASCSSPMHSSPSGPVRFGVVDKQPDGSWEIVRETRTIPLRLHETGFSFGYVYQPTDKHEYTIHDVSYLPSEPVSLTGAIGARSIDHATRGLKTPDYTVSGEHGMEYWFDEGDPLGAYRLDVIVNGQCVESIDFTVVEFRGAPTKP